MSTKRQCLAIAYRWEFPPPTPVGEHGKFQYDLALVVCLTRSEIDGDNIQAPKTDARKRAVYRARLPKKGEASELADVSGTLGLVYPASGQHFHRRASAAEKLIGDAIIWALAEESLEPAASPLILIQGPIIPKLRGRLLYRGLDPKVRLFGLTYRIDWLQHIESCSRMIDGLGGNALSEIYPPPGIDKATRTWAGQTTTKDASKHYYHLESIVDPDECCANPDWQQNVERDAKLIIANCKPYKKNTGRFASQTPLPAPMAEAISDVRMRRNGEAHLIRLLQHLRSIARTEAKTIRAELIGSNGVKELVDILDPEEPSVPARRNAPKVVTEDTETQTLINMVPDDSHQIVKAASKEPPSKPPLDWSSEALVLAAFNSANLEELSDIH